MLESLCLATIIYHEARGLEPKAQSFVADVAIERASREGTTICKSMVGPGNYAFEKRKAMLEPDAKVLARKIALEKLSSKHRRKEYTYFNHKRLGKRFATKTKPIVLGTMIFY